jgi:hypothetical protein
MIHGELADTLIALIEGLIGPPGSGLVVTEGEVELPLEVQEVVRDGRLIVTGGPPHTRWKSGVLPRVHLGRVRVVAPEGDDGG